MERRETPEQQIVKVQNCDDLSKVMIIKGMIVIVMIIIAMIAMIVMIIMIMMWMETIHLSHCDKLHPGFFLTLREH